MGKLLDIFRLWRYHRNIDRLIDKGRNTPRQILGRFFDLNKNNKSPKGGVERRLGYSIMTQLRSRQSYRVRDYSKAKKMYEDYFKIDNHIHSFEDIVGQVKHGDEVYVVQFRRDVPVKGVKYCEYHINGSGSDTPITYKLQKVSDSGNYINMEACDGEYANVSSISKDGFTNYRYATEDEILDFNVRGSKLKELNRLMEELQEKKSNLYGEMDKIKRYR